MSRAINREEAMVPELELTVPEKAIGLLPIVLPIVGTILLILVRIQAGRSIGFIYCDALIMLALISYICAAVILVTNIFVKDNIFIRPQFDVHYVPNLHQFGSNVVTEESVWVGYRFGGQ